MKVTSKKLWEIIKFFISFPLYSIRELFDVYIQQDKLFNWRKKKKTFDNFFFFHNFLRKNAKRFEQHFLKRRRKKKRFPFQLFSRSKTEYESQSFLRFVWRYSERMFKNIHQVPCNAFRASRTSSSSNYQAISVVMTMTSDHCTFQLKSKRRICTHINFTSIASDFRNFSVRKYFNNLTVTKYQRRFVAGKVSRWCL